MIDPKLIEMNSGDVNSARQTISAQWPGLETEWMEDAELSSFAELLEHYDYGELFHAGAMNMAAKFLVSDAPKNLEIESTDDLQLIDFEVPLYFHHGDVHAKSSINLPENTFITGDLVVEGTISASFLDAFSYLMVGGNLICESIRFSGLCLVAGDFTFKKLAVVESQGENIILGKTSGKWLVQEYGSTEAWNDVDVELHVDRSETDLLTLAAQFGVSVETDETSHDLLSRLLFEAG